MSRRAPLLPPEFFIDRSLGRRHLAAALTAYGLVIDGVYADGLRRLLPRG